LIQDSQRQNLRRSTRVPLDVSIEIEGEAGALKGVTVVVNLHGALIRTVKPIPLGARIRVTVYLTGKSASARVVYIAEDSTLTSGIELDKPLNIWGVSLTPDDWEGEEHGN
jgi:PilZ domain